MTAFQATQMSLWCLEALLLSKGNVEGHTLPHHCEPSLAVNQGCGSQRVQSVFIQEYISMASFSLLSSPPFVSYLQLRDRRINLTLFQSVFYHISRWYLHSQSHRTLGHCPVRSVPGAGWQGWWETCHTADGLFSFTWLIAPHSAKGSHFILLWDHCVWKWQTQTPGALQRLKASQDCCCSRHPLHWHDGMKGRMSPLPSPPPTSFLPFNLSLISSCCVGYF